MNNFFLEAMEILKKQRAGQELTQDEQETLNAAMIALDHSYDDIPIDEGLEKLAELLQPSPQPAYREFWLVTRSNGSFPLTPDIRINGRIAELVKSARRPHTCRACRGGILVDEPYYKVLWGGAGLGDMKHPDHVHVACLPAFLHRDASCEEMKYLWGLLFDYAHTHCGDLAKYDRLAGYTAGMQRVWSKSRELKGEGQLPRQEACPAMPWR